MVNFLSSLSSSSSFSSPCTEGYCVFFDTSGWYDPTEALRLHKRVLLVVGELRAANFDVVCSKSLGENVVSAQVRTADEARRLSTWLQRRPRCEGCRRGCSDCRPGLCTPGRTPSVA